MLLDLLTGRLFTASFCNERVTCIRVNCKFTLGDVTEQSHQLELEEIGSDAGTALDMKSRMLAEPRGKLWQ